MKNKNLILILTFIVVFCSVAYARQTGVFDKIRLGSMQMIEDNITGSTSLELNGPDVNINVATSVNDKISSQTITSTDSSGFSIFDGLNLKLLDSDSTNFVSLKSPAVVATDVNLTLPDNDGNVGEFLQTDGSGILSWASVVSGANTTLSNLTSPTSINQNLLFPDLLKDIGNSTFPLRDLYTQEVIFHTYGGNDQRGYIYGDALGLNIDSQTGNGDRIRISAEQDLELLSQGAGFPILIQTVGAGGVGSSGTIDIKTGNVVSGISGNINLTTGTSSGTRGSIRLVDGSEGTSGQCWVSGDTIGSGSWQDCPGGSSFGTNYVTNSDAETDTSDWTQYDDGATAVIIDATGGVANDLTFSRTTVASEILIGSASFKMALGATDSQGEGVSITLSQIDPRYIGDVLEVSFQYKTASDYTSGNIYVGLVNVTNSNAVVECLNDDNADVIKTTTKGSKFLCQFYPEDTDSNNVADTYRLAFHVASTSVSTELFFDDVFVSPTVTVPQAVMSDWTEFVPVWKGATSDPSSIVYSSRKCFWRRVGGNMEIRCALNFTSASGGAGVAYVEIPGGYSIDTNQLPGTTNNTQEVVGSGSWSEGSTQKRGQVEVYNGIGLTIRGLTESTAVEDTLLSGVFNSIARIGFEATIPISGWSSGAVISTTDNLYQNVIAVYDVTTGTANTAFADNVEERVDFNSQVIDTHSAVSVDSGTSPNSPNNDWTFTAPRAGNYQVSIMHHWANATNLNSSAAYLYKNGSQYKIIGGIEEPTANANGTSMIVDLARGDTLHITAKQDDSASGSRNIATGAVFGSRISIMSIPDFKQFGLRGEVENKETVITSDTQTTLSATWTAVTGSSITLSPGKWLLGYDVTAILDENSGAANSVYGQVRIVDSGGTLVGTSVSLMAETNMTANNIIYGNLSKSIIVNVTADETYSLEVLCNEASAAGDFGIAGTSTTGVLTDPDTHSKIWAQRIQ